MGSELWKQIAKQKIPMYGCPWSVMGISVAGRHTCIMIDGLGFMFDCGFPSDQCPSHIFITHPHGDHVDALPRHILDPPDGRIPIIIVPKPMAQNLREYIASSIKLTKHHEEKFVGKKLKYEMKEISLHPDQKSMMVLSEYLLFCKAS